ncbi:MAG: hypothetical protein ACOCZB_08815 [Spirochaetota bacterium]
MGYRIGVLECGNFGVHLVELFNAHPLVGRRRDRALLAAVAARAAGDRGAEGGQTRLLGATNLRERAPERNPNLVRLAHLISEAQAAGFVGRVDVDLVVRSLWTAAQGLVIRLVLDDVEAGDKRDRLIAGYLDLLLNELQRRDQ